MLRDQKKICDCAMSLNDDREKIPRKGKGKSLRGKSDQGNVTCPLKNPYIYLIKESMCMYVLSNLPRNRAVLL